MCLGRLLDLQYPDLTPVLISAADFVVLWKNGILTLTIESAVIFLLWTIGSGQVTEEIGTSVSSGDHSGDPALLSALDTSFYFHNSLLRRRSDITLV